MTAHTAVPTSRSHTPAQTCIRHLKRHPRHRLRFASACGVALLAAEATSAQQLRQQTGPAQLAPVVSAFTLQIRNDTANYPPLPRGTDLVQWYRDGVDAGDPATAIQAEETPILTAVTTLKTKTSHTRQQGGLDAKAWGGPHFDVAEFEAQLRQRMDYAAIGYSYAINFQKTLYTADGWGLERNTNDGIAWHDGYRRMNIASISKTLTAVAVLQLLEKNGLSIDDPVGPWLPDDWTKGYGFDNPQFISFRDLLTHRSGLKQTIVAIEAFDEEFAALDKVKWDGLKAVVEWGIIPVYHGDYEYSNVNYALFRLIIPELWKASGENPGIGELDENEAAALYGAYMAENLFIPLGIHQAACHEESETSQVLYYNVYDPWGDGAAPGNWSLSCGSGGWFLSAYNLANLMANIRYNDSILSPVMRSLMDQHKLGWSSTWSQTGNHGLYLAHAGALYFDTADYPDRREMEGCVMKFPIHVEAVLLVNSSIENNVLPCTTLAAAFDAAWVN